MNLPGQVGHLLKKDLMRFWPLMAGIGLLLAIQLVSGPSLGGETRGWIQNPAGFLSGGVLGVVLAVFGALVIQEDPLVGDHIPWLSRPISPVALLLEKFLFVGGFCVLAPAILQGWALESYWPSISFLQMTLESIVAQGFFVALLAVPAALTSNFKSLLAYGVMFLAGTAIFFLAFQGPQGGSGFDSGLSTTEEVVSQAWWMATGALLVAVQILTRRTRVVLVLAVTAFLIPHLFGGLWRWDWSIDPIGRGESIPYADSSRVTMTLEYITLEPGGSNAIRSGEEGMDATLRVKGPPDLIAIPTGISSRITGPAVDETIPSKRFWSHPSLDTTGRRLLGFEWIGSEQTPTYSDTDATLFMGPRREMDRIRGETRELEISASFRAHRPILLGRLPLEEGARITTDQGMFRLDRLTRASGSISVSVSRISVQSNLEVTHGSWDSSDRWGLSLVNEARSEVFPSLGRSGSGRGRFLLVAGPTVTVYNREADFNAGTVDRRSWIEREIPESWFEDAELVVVGMEYVGSFEKTLTLDGSVLPSDFGPGVSLSGPAGSSGSR